jgi:hypothetical protein
MMFNILARQYFVAKTVHRAEHHSNGIQRRVKHGGNCTQNHASTSVGRMLPSQIRSLTIRRYTKPEVYSVVEIDVPAIGEEDVLVGAVDAKSTTFLTMLTGQDRGLRYLWDGTSQCRQSAVLCSELRDFVGSALSQRRVYGKSTPIEMLCNDAANGPPVKVPSNSRYLTSEALSVAWSLTLYNCRS